MLKLSENPPLRHPPARSISDYTGQWWVAHTKPRCEKAFAFDLLAMEVPYFLPQVKRTYMSGGRRRQAMLPLFASYVFFCGSDENRYRALCGGRLVQVIQVKDQQLLVRELAALEHVLDRGTPLDPYTCLLRGRRCRVIAGPLKDVEGLIIQRNGDSPRFVLQVSLLGQGAEVQIEGDLLEVIE